MHITNIKNAFQMEKTKACTSPIFLGIFHFNIGTGSTSDLLWLHSKTC